MAEDELVTKIVYEVDEESKAVLKEADKQPERIAKSVDKMGKSQKKATVEEKLFAKETAQLNKEFRASDKLMGGMDKQLGFLRGGFLGVGAAVGIGAAALYKFGKETVNAAEKGVKLSNTAFSLQMSPEELQVMGQAFTQLGGTIENFQSDASRYMQMTGNALDVSAIEDLYERLKGLSDKEALNLMRSFGFSDDLTRIVRETGDSFGYVAEGIRSTGNALDDDQIRRFKELDVASGALSATFTRLKDSLYSAAAPTITDGLTQLNNVILGMTGNITSLDNAVSKFNGKPFLENMESGDLEVRAKALEERLEEVGEQDTLLTSQEGKDKLDVEYEKAEAEFKKLLTDEFGEEGYQKLREEAERNGRQLTDGTYTLGRNKGVLGGVTNKGLFNEYSKNSKFAQPEVPEEESDGNALNAAVDNKFNDVLFTGPKSPYLSEINNLNSKLSGDTVSEREWASYGSVMDHWKPTVEATASSDKLGTYPTEEQPKNESTWGSWLVDLFSSPRQTDGSFAHAMNGMRQPMNEDRYVQLPASQTDIENHYNTTEGSRDTNSQQSSTTTNTIHVEQYITAPDPQSAGDAAARGIGEVLNEQTNTMTLSPGNY